MIPTTNPVRVRNWATGQYGLVVGVRGWGRYAIVRYDYGFDVPEPWAALCSLEEG